MRDVPTQLSCPVDFALQLLGNRWSIQILRDLFHGTKRTSELLRSLSGISPRTLSDRLHELEDWGVISRTVYAEVPPRVEYSLTEMGEELRGVIDELSKVGELWQARFDAKPKHASCSHCLLETPLRCPILERSDASVAPGQKKSRKSTTGDKL